MSYVFPGLWLHILKKIWADWNNKESIEETKCLSLSCCWFSMKKRFKECCNRVLAESENPEEGVGFRESWWNLKGFSREKFFGKKGNPKIFASWELWDFLSKHCFWSAECYTKFLTTCPTPVIKHFIKINVIVRWWPYEKKLSTKYFIYLSCTIRKVLVSEMVMWQVKRWQTKSMTSATNIFTFICECTAHICLRQINNVEIKHCWVLLNFVFMI